MTNLLRNKRTLYLCKEYIEPNTNLTKYHEPITIKTNYQAISSDGEIIALGSEYTKFLKINDSKSIGENFSNGDKCYVYVNKPETHDEFCYGADYIVEGEPIISLNESQVTLRRLTGEKE